MSAMAYNLIAAARRSYTYSDGWSHLDEWREPMAFKILAGRITVPTQP